MPFDDKKHQELLNELTSVLDEAEEKGQVGELLAAYFDLLDRYMDGQDPSKRITNLANALRPNLHAKMVLREVLRIADEDENFIELEKSIQRSFTQLREQLAQDRTEP